MGDGMYAKSLFLETFQVEFTILPVIYIKGLDFEDTLPFWNYERPNSPAFGEDVVKYVLPQVPGLENNLSKFICFI